MGERQLAAQITKEVFLELRQFAEDKVLSRLIVFILVAFINSDLSGKKQVDLINNLELERLKCKMERPRYNLFEFEKPEYKTIKINYPDDFEKEYLSVLDFIKSYDLQKSQFIRAGIDFFLSMDINLQTKLIYDAETSYTQTHLQSKKILKKYAEIVHIPKEFQNVERSLLYITLTETIAIIYYLENEDGGHFPFHDLISRILPKFMDNWVFDEAMKQKYESFILDEDLLTKREKKSKKIKITIPKNLLPKIISITQDLEKISFAGFQKNSVSRVVNFALWHEND